MPTHIPRSIGGAFMYRLTFRIIIFLAIAGLLGLSAIMLPPASRATDTGNYLSAEVVVKLVRSTDLPAIASQYGLDPFPIDQFGSRALYLLRIIDGSSPNDKAEELFADPQARVLYAEPHLLQQPPEVAARVTWSAGGGSGDYVAQWAPNKIRLPEAHTLTRGAGITVAVLD